MERRAALGGQLMARGKPKLFVCIGHQSVGVLELDSAKIDRAGQATLKARIARTLRIPHDIDPSSERDLASWLAASLEHAGCSSKGVTLVLERSDVVAKRLKLEGIERGDVDLPGMVRYQLMRQVAFQTDDAPIDFMLLQPKVRSLKEVTGDAEVLAATAPIARVDHLRKVCEEAGLDVQRIAVLSLGLGEIAESAMADRVGPTLVIAPTLDGIDYSIHQAGRALSSRWIETQHRASEQDLTELIVSEARRTRMSHQLTPDSESIHSALIISEPGGVLGDHDEVATRVGDVLGVITEVVDPRSQPWLTVKGEWESERLLGLLGLAISSAKASAGASGQMHQIDLAHPIKPADKSAATRQLVMAAILLLIISLGAIKSFGNLKVRSVESDIDALRENARNVEATYHEAIRQHAAAEYIHRWHGASASPIEHLEQVVRLLPSNEAVLVKSFSWGVRSLVDYPRQRGESGYDPANWQDNVVVTIGLELLAADREVADATRATFVAQPSYTVRTAGPDGARANNAKYPEQLELVMESRDRRPVQDRTEDADATPEAGS